VNINQTQNNKNKTTNKETQSLLRVRTSNTRTTCNKFEVAAKNKIEKPSRKRCPDLAPSLSALCSFSLIWSALSQEATKKICDTTVITRFSIINVVVKATFRLWQPHQHRHSPPETRHTHTHLCTHPCKIRTRALVRIADTKNQQQHDDLPCSLGLSACPLSLPSLHKLQTLSLAENVGKQCNRFFFCSHMGKKETSR